MSVVSVSKVGLRSVRGDKGLLAIKVCRLQSYMVSKKKYSIKVNNFFKAKILKFDGIVMVQNRNSQMPCL